jgi:hypothetical protein
VRWLCLIAMGCTPLLIAAASSSAANVSVSGRAWHDLNGNGQFESNEPPVTDQRILLFDWRGWTETLTDARGRYEFRDVSPGPIQLNLGAEIAGQRWVAT